MSAPTARGSAAAAGHPLTPRRQEGYGHGYSFVSSFIDDHLRHHARALVDHIAERTA